MKITNNECLPKPFVSFAESDYEYKNKQYSVSAITRGLKQTILKRRHFDELEQDVSEMIWLLLGTAVHKVLEEAEEEDSELKEEYLKIDIGDYKLSGRFDLYNGDTKTITDYKTSSVWKVIYEDYDDYRLQLLIYAWLLRQIGIEVEKAQAILILKDHKKTRAKYKKDYPNLPVKKIEFTFTDEDFELIEQFIRIKFEKIRQYERLPDDEIPPCSPEDRWRKPDKFAVKEDGKKKACRVLDSKEDAEKWMKNNRGDYIEYRPGEDKKCKDFCLVNEYCDYYNEVVLEQEEVS